jgi:hypothetical protein
MEIGEEEAGGARFQIVAEDTSVSIMLSMAGGLSSSFSPYLWLLYGDMRTIIRVQLRGFRRASNAGIRCMRRFRVDKSMSTCSTFGHACTLRARRFSLRRKFSFA